jgi:methionyl-tRNA formyltransferase
MVRIGFIGCHEISWFCLKKICELSTNHDDEVVVVFNLDSETASKHSASIRFENLQSEHNFLLYNVENITDNKNLQILKNSNLDILFIIGWHRIVPQEVLDTAKIRIGIHSSLLPKDRGSSPINWQIIRGDKIGGVTLFHLTTGVDAGEIIDQEKYEIKFNDDVREVYFKATSSSINLLEKNWNQFHNKKIHSLPQNEGEITLNDRRKPGDGRINWLKNSTDCHNWIRSLTFPYPGAFTFWNNQKIFVWKSQLSNIEGSEPGKIINSGDKIIISTGKNCLELLSLQIENHPLCNAQLFTTIYGLQKNDYFQ